MDQFLDKETYSYAKTPETFYLIKVVLNCLNKHEYKYITPENLFSKKDFHLASLKGQSKI